MKYDYANVRIYKNTRDRLKIKAAKQGISIMKLIDKFSKE